ncbi:hypothetical protein ACXIVK_36080 [Paraburkholderia caledonica]
MTAAVIAIEAPHRAQNPSQRAKTTIKEATRLMLADIPVMRHGELIFSLEAHMTPAERGRHFFDVREAINELIDAGELCVFQVAATTGATVRLVAMSGSQLQRIA